jgi:general secretion pathway protein E/type IV pilus assembly protein PilB
MIDMGVEPFLVASTVEGVMAQRLVRTICPECKAEYDPHEADVPPDFPHKREQVAALYPRGAPPAELLTRFQDGKLRLYKGMGCRACRQTGYRGRTGIYELMVTGDSIREMCVQRVNASLIRKQALQEGMITLRQDGWRKVLLGITTIDEVVRNTAGDVIA